MKKCLSVTANRKSNKDSNDHDLNSDYSLKTRNFKQLSDNILENCLELVNNQFGNYLVQTLLEIAEPDLIEELHSNLRTRYGILSLKKFSSNVVEKFLFHSTPTIREQIIEELITVTDFKKLLEDSFGNYVVQNALQHAASHQVLQLEEKIKPLIKTARRNVKRKWERSIKQANIRISHRRPLSNPSLPVIRSTLKESLLLDSNDLDQTSSSLNDILQNHHQQSSPGLLSSELNNLRENEN